MRPSFPVFCWQRPHRPVLSQPSSPPCWAEELRGTLGSGQCGKHCCSVSPRWQMGRTAWPFTRSPIPLPNSHSLTLPLPPCCPPRWWFHAPGHSVQLESIFGVSSGFVSCPAASLTPRRTSKDLPGTGLQMAWWAKQRYAK